jgi:hypothetical protein
VSPVKSASAVGNYVGKYITKAYEETGLAKLGFKRIWSTSQGFAPDLRVRLAGTIAGKWTKVEHFFSKYDQGDWLNRGRDDPDLKLVGHPLVMEKIEKRERQRKLKVIEDLQREFTNNKQTDGRHGSGGGHGPGDSVPTHATR